MRANPGGEIAPEHVIGRGRLIRRLWQMLEQQSGVLVSERRMGKSCVMKKMEAERPAAMLTFYADVEGIDSPLGFVERVYHDIDGYLSRRKKVAGRVRALLRELAGVEIGGIVKLPQVAEVHWQALLERAFEDLTEHQEGVLIFFWDEFPLMLQKIRQSTDERTAMNLLDTLRSLRQSHSGLRMVLAGSIGLHHVTAALSLAGHANDATNDMRTIEVPPLAKADTCLLAKELIQGEALDCADPPSTARAIATATDCIPYYVHHVVSLMKDRGNIASADLAESIVADALVDPQDIWHLQHYHDRLERYYGRDWLPVVLFLLDELAVAQEAVGFDTLCTRLAGGLRGESEQGRRILAGDRELLRRILVMLQRDHYVLQRRDDGAYLFRFPLIRRWWIIHRNLA